MKILMILREDYPFDIRVSKEASRLIADGHEVSLVCFNRKRLPPEETIEGMHVFRLSPWPSLLRKAHTLCNNMPYSNPAWYGFILRKAREWGAEALHVHDLPLARTVINVGRKLDVPVIFDMHENWPELLPSMHRRLIERLLATRFTFKAVEIEVCKDADAIIVVVEESMKRLEKLSIPAEKIIITPNVVDLRRIPSSLRDLPRREGGVEFIYAGGLSHHRGLDILLKAWKAVGDKHPDARLIIAGSGPDGEKLMRLTKYLGLESSVSFPGFLNFSNYLRSLSSCDVGVVPHISTPHTDSTLPHKLFHLMALKKPVVVGDATPLKRIVESENCGLAVRSGDVEGMAGALAKLASNPDLRRKMGENGYLAVKERYNWDVGVRSLLQFYAKLSSRDGDGSL